MRRFDLQVHTDASPCSRASPREVVDAAMAAGLDGIAITNHDTLEGCAAVTRLAPPELTVLPSVEVSTTQGHILAIDVDDVPPRGDPLSVIDAIHDRNGLAVLSHPFDTLRESYTSELEPIAEAVDAVEVLNSRCVRSRYNDAALTFAERHALARTGGSDAHFAMEVGRAFTTCEGSIRGAIRDGSTDVGGRAGYLSGHVATKLNDALRYLGR